MEFPDVAPGATPGNFRSSSSAADRKLQTILSHEIRPEGEHFVTFAVEQLPNRQYFMVLATGGVQWAQKMVLAK